MAKQCNKILERGVKRRLDCRTLGADPDNRGGVLTNESVVHVDVLGSVKKDGHDKNKTPDGVAVEYKSEPGLQALHDHNKKIAANSSHMPQVYEDLMKYGTLACTHWNTGLRCSKDKMVSPEAGDLGKLVETDDTYREEVEHGHTWIVLPESTTQAEKRLVSMWKNQEQNKNKTLDEVEILRLCLTALDELGQSGRTQVAVGFLSQAVTQRVPVKLGLTVVSAFARWTLAMCEGKTGGRGFVEDYLEWHSGTINPKEMSLPSTFFDSLCKTEELKGKPCAQLVLVVTNYTDEKKIVKMRPAPDVCKFIVGNDLERLARNPGVIDLMDDTARKWLCDLLPKVSKEVPAHLAKVEVYELCRGLGRMALGRSLKTLSFPSKLEHSAWGPDRIEDLLTAWAQHMQGKYTLWRFCDELGVEGPKATKADLDLEEVLATKFKIDPDAPLGGSPPGFASASTLVLFLLLALQPPPSQPSPPPLLLFLFILLLLLLIFLLFLFRGSGAGGGGG